MYNGSCQDLTSSRPQVPSTPFWPPAAWGRSKREGGDICVGGLSSPQMIANAMEQKTGQHGWALPARAFACGPSQPGKGGTSGPWFASREPSSKCDWWLTPKCATAPRLDSQLRPLIGEHDVPSCWARGCQGSSHDGGAGLPRRAKELQEGTEKWKARPALRSAACEGSVPVGAFNPRRVHPIFSGVFSAFDHLAAPGVWSGNEGALGSCGLLKRRARTVHC